MFEKFTKISLLILSIFMSCCTSIKCQNKVDYSWILGTYNFENPNITIIKFNSDTILSVSAVKGDASVYTDAGLICDTDGNLKVIATNCAVMNSNFDTVSNSNLLKDRYLNYCQERNGAFWPFEQSVLVLPFIGDKNKFRILFTNTQSISTEQDSLRSFFYSYLNGAVIDFSKKEQGELINVWQRLYNDTITVSHITACKKDNNEDWWIILPMDGRPCYSILSYSIDTIEFFKKDCLGKIGFNNIDFEGQASFSPDRTKHARFNIANGLHLFDFDSKSGSLLNPRLIKLSVPPGNISGGLCFSPNSKYLYVFCDKLLYQLDVSNPDVESTKVLIDTLDLTSGKEYIASFNHGLLAPDGRIYISGIWDSKYLNVINSPNCKGKLCDLVQQAIPLPTKNSWGVPNYPHFRDRKDVPECPPDKTIEWSESNYKIEFKDSFLTYDFKSSKPKSISFYELSGRLIKLIELTNSNGQINIDFLSNGYFIVKIVCNNRQYIEKIIKL